MFKFSRRGVGQWFDIMRKCRKLLQRALLFKLDIAYARSQLDRADYERCDKTNRASARLIKSTRISINHWTIVERRSPGGE